MGIPHSRSGTIVYSNLPRCMKNPAKVQEFAVKFLLDFPLNNSKNRCVKSLKSFESSFLAAKKVMFKTSNKGKHSKPWNSSWISGSLIPSLKLTNIAHEKSTIFSGYCKYPSKNGGNVPVSAMLVSFQGGKNPNPFFFCGSSFPGGRGEGQKATFWAAKGRDPWSLWIFCRISWSNEQVKP